MGGVGVTLYQWLEWLALFLVTLGVIWSFTTHRRAINQHADCIDALQGQINELRAKKK